LRIYLVVIFISVVFSVALGVEESAKPVILYGRDVSVIGKSHKPRALPEDLLGKFIAPGDTVRSNSQKLFILYNDNEIIELSEYTTIGFGEYVNDLKVVKGLLTLHFRYPSGTSSYIVDADSAQVRYPGMDSVWVRFADSTMAMRKGSIVANNLHSNEIGEWCDVSSGDAEYLFRKVLNGRLPASKFNFRFPSDRLDAFKQRSRGRGGVATYEEERYYYTGTRWTMNFYYLEFSYDFWFAVSDKWQFYSGNWNEWKDLVDNIHHIQLFKPGDPFFLRTGLIENLTFDRGMLVDNYNNAVFLPFDKRNGLEIRAKLGKLRMNAFANDIGNPKVFGFHGAWEANKRFRISFSYAGDIDQLVDIEDSDGDFYPDVTDPQPDIFNHPGDSIILAYPSISLNDISSKNIHGVSFGMRYKFLRDRYFSGKILGEGAVLDNGGVGITFPNIAVGYRWVTIGAGMDFQTPRFQNGIFDRTYEYEKARFVENDDGEIELITRESELSTTEGWLYGWNNSFSLNVAEHFRFNTRFRDMYREKSREKRFSMKLDINHEFIECVNKISFFIEQKNVAQLFQKRSDGGNCGFGIEIEPHKTVRIKFRYRERYEDYNRDGDIAGNEVKRNFDANAIIDGNYWWRKLVEWRREKRALKTAPEVQSEANSSLLPSR